VQRISIHGVRYGSPEDLMVEAGIDRGVNIFSDLTAFEESLRQHPLVRDVHFERRPPRSILIRVEEREPFAILAAKRPVPVARDGTTLPRERIAVDLDVPLLTVRGLEEGEEPDRERVRDGLAYLASIKRDTPELAAHVSELVVGEGGPEVLYLRTPRARVILGGEWNEIVSGLLSGVAGHLEPTQGLYEIDLRFARQAIVRERVGEGEQPVYGAI
jgi:cell division protein FtsQ